MASAAGTTSYIGTGKYCYIGFADGLGLQDHAGPYIPNKATGSTLRIVNVPTATVPSSVANTGNVTIITHMKPHYHPPATWKADWYDATIIGSAPNFFRSFYIDKTSGGLVAQKQVGGAPYTTSGASTAGIVRGGVMKIASGLRGGALRICVNGGAVATGADTSIPSSQTSIIGVGDISALVTRVEIYARAMSESEYVARSTP
jgi:hypothetical protein